MDAAIRFDTAPPRLARSHSSSALSLTEADVAALLAVMHGTRWLLAALIYGAGLRLDECLRLRVRDLDFTRRRLMVRTEAGAQERIAPLPARAMRPLLAHLDKVRALHRQDLASGRGEARLPGILARKHADASREWGWQYVFPSVNLEVDPSGGSARRAHLAPATVRRALEVAASEAGIGKAVDGGALRAAFARHLRMADHAAATAKPGYSQRALRSPLDTLPQ